MSSIPADSINLTNREKNALLELEDWPATHLGGYNRKRATMERLHDRYLVTYGHGGTFVLTNKGRQVIASLKKSAA